MATWGMNASSVPRAGPRNPTVMTSGVLMTTFAKKETRLARSTRFGRPAATMIVPNAVMRPRLKIE